MKFTVTADAAGDAELRNLTITFRGTADATCARLYGGGTQIVGRTDTTGVGGKDDIERVTFDITGRTERIIAAGESRTFTVRADANVATGNTLIASIDDTTAHFVWQDGSDVDGIVGDPSDNIDGHLVEILPVTGDTLRP